MNSILFNELNGEELLLIASVKLTNELIHKIENDDLNHNTYMIFNKIIRVRDETMAQISRKIGTSEKRLVKFFCGEKQQNHLKLKNGVLNYLFGVNKPEYLLYSKKEIEKIKKIKRRKGDTKAEIIDYPYNTKEYMEKAIESIAEGVSEAVYDE